MPDIAALILAAGKGTRMKSGLVKVMHPLGEKPMIAWPVRAAKGAGANRTVLVIGHQSEKVRAYFAGEARLDYAEQTEQLGTGHAVSCASHLLENFQGEVLILCGDVPLIRPETLREFISFHLTNRATVTVLTVQIPKPQGYGRVVKNESGEVLRIVEEKDASSEERNILEINTGIYCINAPFLFKAVADLSNDNAQGEYYLTDILSQGSVQGEKCLAYTIGDMEEVMGVNDRVQLAEAARLLRRRINEGLMLSGVTMIDPEVTYIEEGVEIGADSIVYPNVHISGDTVVGSGCVIEPSVVIRGCRIGDRVTIKAGSVLADSIIHDGVNIGPMAHLRPGNELGKDVKIGNFVEAKKVQMGEGSKASHLTYLGDSTIGSHVNIGCGTITCNYDGVKKHRTVIEDDVFVGSDVQFVAPVTVGRNSLIAAGSTVTKDVPPNSLAIARSPQVNKEGWKLRKKE
jgi:bifunctional UDP-N-acetylglucosamine pyrophosphorylase/glucosamine-1-phosphate N-acetyltransferase